MNCMNIVRCRGCNRSVSRFAHEGVASRERWQVITEAEGQIVRHIEARPSPVYHLIERIGPLQTS
jgi:hypothetical protein